MVGYEQEEVEKLKIAAPFDIFKNRAKIRIVVGGFYECKWKSRYVTGVRVLDMTQFEAGPS